LPIAPQRPSPTRLGTVAIHQGDNLPLLESLASSSFRLVYLDPPFNTGRVQRRVRLETTRDPAGDRRGFAGQRYRTRVRGQDQFEDTFDDYLGFLRPRLVQVYRLLTPDGSLFVHMDYREVHYVKVMLDGIFGRESFINEIIWAYDYGARSTRRWSPKHDNLLFYAKDPRRYVFNLGAVDRIPYLAPKLVGEAKAARGKTPTDTWWQTIVSPTGKEKTGYPTQKPLAILRRIVRVHSEPGDRVLDAFAGSGSFGEAAAAEGRHVELIDSSPRAVAVMTERLRRFAPTVSR